jgi:signal transduction histidine kinase
LTVIAHDGIPDMVKGDATRLRQILTNLTRNAFQNSVDEGVKVDIRRIRTIDGVSTISITVQDAGVGMTEQQLDVD